MNGLNKLNRSISYIAYILIAIATIGFFSIYVPAENPGTPLSAWFLLAGIGGIIVGLKTLRFSSDKRPKIVLYDLIYLFILVGFSLFSLPFGGNFILGGVLAVLFLYFQIDQKILVDLE